MWCHPVTRPSVTTCTGVCQYGDTKCGHGLCPLGTQQHHQHHLYQLEDAPLIINYYLIGSCFSTHGDYGNEIFFYNIHTHTKILIAELRSTCKSEE